MNVTLCSAFRNSCGYLDRYLDQVTNLHLVLSERGDRLHCVWGEGDSVDDTLARLVQTARHTKWPVTQVDCTHGGPEFGSVIDPERFRQLGHVGRSIWAAIPANADVVLWVESDLVWEAATLAALIDRLGSFDAVAPAVVLDRTGWPRNNSVFYDTYCFVRHGIRFDHRRPWHPDNDGETPLQMDSVGSCVAMRGYIAKGLLFDDRTIWPDLCRQINDRPAGAWFDPKLTVIHP